jgi:ketosteroid isomerase-like protein
MPLTVQDAIKKQNKKFVKAFNSGDNCEVGFLYANDAVLLPPGARIPDGMIKGRNKIANYWRGGIEEFQNLVFTTISIEVLGKRSACEIGKFSVIVKDKKKHRNAGRNVKKSRKTGRYVVVWRKIGNDWLLGTDIADWDSGK